MSGVNEIKVMISSQCRTPIKYGGKDEPLSVVRSDLKSELESETLFGVSVFDVWISEDPPAPSLEDTSWEKCLNEVREADMVIVLYTGAAGWAKHSGEVGICHAELETAMNAAPGKVRFLKLPNIVPATKAEELRNARFSDYISKISPFWRGANTGEEVIDLTKQALHEAVCQLVKRGVVESSRGKFHFGAALDWSRLDFTRRQREMVDTLKSTLHGRDKAREISGDLVVEVAGDEVLFKCHAIPAAMSIASAREMVGQPFLSDHLCATLRTSKCGGPVHVIACNRSITEAQALKILGYSDATVLSPPFGVYVADNVQKVQLIFIKDCRDDTSTRHGMQRCFDWLESSGEGEWLRKRAMSRKRIVEAIASENVSTSTAAVSTAKK